MVGIAQLVSAPDCGSGGLGFESQYPPCGSLSGDRRAFCYMMGHRQAVRHRVLIPASAGSNPAGPESEDVFGRVSGDAFSLYGKCSLPAVLHCAKKMRKNLKMLVHFADDCGIIGIGM